jgi:predicted ferric reductase
VTQVHTWWYLARASGLVAWTLLAVSVLWGLLLSTRVFDRSISPKWITDLHRFLGGTALLFTAIHVAALVGDSYLHFAAKEILVPFASTWRPVAVAWGVISLWVLIAVELTSLLMKHLPRRVWHAIHLSSFGLFFAATAHAISAGTDTGSTFFIVGCTALLSTVVLLTLVRVLAPRPRRAKVARPVELVAVPRAEDAEAEVARAFRSASAGSPTEVSPMARSAAVGSRRRASGAP